MKIIYNIRLPVNKVITTDIMVMSKGITDHAKLDNLDYESCGHTGFASSEDLKSYAQKEDMPICMTIEDIENILNGGK